MAIEDEIKDVQQLVVNQLGVANGLDNSIADGQVTPAKLSTGAPEWTTSGQLHVKGPLIEINPDLVGDSTSYIDFHSTSASNPNYDARISKDGGEDGNFNIANKGSGQLRLTNSDTLKFQTSGGNEGFTKIYSGGSGANGAHIELYGSTYSGEENNAYYDADRHRFRSAAGGTNPSYVDMNMTDQGDAELHIESADSTGEANLKLTSFTPSVIFQDKTTGAKDHQIMSNSGTLYIKEGDSSGDTQLDDFDIAKFHSDNTQLLSGGKRKVQLYPDYTALYGGHNSADGTWIAMYGDDHSTGAGNISFCADKHQFRDKDGSSSPSYIDMHMDDQNAEMVIGSNDASGEANLTITSFTPSIILSDKTTATKDFQILADSNELRFKSGYTPSGHSQLSDEILALHSDGRLQIVGAGENAHVFIKGTRDNTTTTDRLELQADEVALMSGSNYATEILRAQGNGVYVPSGPLVVGTTDTSLYNNLAGGDAGVVLHSNRIEVARSGSTCSYLNRLDSDGDIQSFRRDGVEIGVIGANGGALFIGGKDNNYGALRFNNSPRAVVPAESSNGNTYDNSVDLGQSSVRFDDIYATNSSIQTSDANEKQDIEALSEAEQRVAVACKGLLRKFRWKSSVEEKGDEARIHFGIIAQDLQAAFEAEGLDAGRYAMFISSTWTDEETGEEKTRLGVRYSELLAFIIAAI